MNEKIDMETLLQNSIDELFVLHQQAKEDHQKFVMESATLIKSSHKQVADSVSAASRAERAARESSEEAKQANGIAHDASNWLSTLRYAGFWLGAGYLIVGGLLGFIYFNLGKKITERTEELAYLQTKYAMLSDKLKQKNKTKVIYKEARDDLDVEQ